MVDSVLARSIDYCPKPGFTPARCLITTILGTSFSRSNVKLGLELDAIESLVALNVFEVRAE